MNRWEKLLCFWAGDKGSERERLNERVGHVLWEQGAWTEAQAGRGKIRGPRPGPGNPKSTNWLLRDSAVLALHGDKGTLTFIGLSRHCAGGFTCGTFLIFQVTLQGQFYNSHFINEGTEAKLSIWPRSHSQRLGRVSFNPSGSDSEHIVFLWDLDTYKEGRQWASSSSLICFCKPLTCICFVL